LKIWNQMVQKNRNIEKISFKVKVVTFATYGNPYSEINWCSPFNPSKCTHTAVRSEHTPGTVGSYIQRPGSNWGISALLKGTSAMDIEGGRERCSFTPHPPTTPASTETRTCKLLVISPIL